MGGHRREAWIDGVQRFKLQGIVDHEKCRMHAESTTAERLATNVRKVGGLEAMFTRHVEARGDECDKGLIAEMKALYWLAKEDLAMEKFVSLTDVLFPAVEVPHLAAIRRGGNAHYRSHRIRDELLQCLHDVVDKNTQQLLDECHFGALLVDESCDIANVEQMVVHMRLVRGAL